MWVTSPVFSFMDSINFYRQKLNLFTNEHTNNCKQKKRQPGCWSQPEEVTHYTDENGIYITPLENRQCGVLWVKSSAKYLSKSGNQAPKFMVNACVEPDAAVMEKRTIITNTKDGRIVVAKKTTGAWSIQLQQWQTGDLQGRFKITDAVASDLSRFCTKLDSLSAYFSPCSLWRNKNADNLFTLKTMSIETAHVYN